MANNGQEIKIIDSRGREKILTKYADKTKGKNNVGKKFEGVDGFYTDEKKKRHFIKNPQDKKELFTELFAGMLLKEMKRRGLIPKAYHSCLISADYIVLENNTYALIQRVVDFKELYKVIHSGTSDNSRRSPLWETLFGPNLYLMLTNFENYYGLPIILMFSLLLGAYSVHSENIGIQQKKILCFLLYRFIRFDFGDAFRDYGNPDNKDILNPSEYHGLLNFKKIIKNYISNFNGIKDLFPRINKVAVNLSNKLSENTFSELVQSVLKKIPKDLIDSDTQKALAGYMGFSSFETVIFGEEKSFPAFTSDFVSVMRSRLQLLEVLKDPAPINSSYPYQSLVENELEENPLFLNRLKRLYSESLEREKFQQNNEEALSRLNEALHVLQQKYQDLLSQSKENTAQSQLTDLQEKYNNVLKRLDEEKILSQLDQLESKMEKITNKAEKEFHKNSAAYRAAQKLAQGIREAVQHYKRDKNLVEFKKAALKAVKQDRKLLESYGWQAILYNIILAIALLGVGYGIAVLALRKNKSSCLFFGSSLRKYPQKLEERIERITREVPAVQCSA